MLTKCKKIKIATTKKGRQTTKIIKDTNNNSKKATKLKKGKKRNNQQTQKTYSPRKRKWPTKNILHTKN